MKSCKCRYLAVLLLSAMIWIMTCGLTAMAEGNLVPYDGPSSSQSSTVSTPQQSSGQSTTSTPRDYAGEVFKDIQYSEDPAVTSAVSSVAKVLSWVITFVVGVVPYVMSILMVIDIVCILIKQANVLLAGLPIQLFSDTVIEINGIQFVGSGEGNKGSTNVEKKDLKGQSRFLYYIKSKLFDIIIAITLFLLLHTGILFNVVFWVANHIVGWIDGLV